MADDERVEGVFNVTVIYSAEKTSLFSFSEKWGFTVSYVTYSWDIAEKYFLLQ